MAINKIILRDKHGKVIASDSFTALESVNVSMDGNVGEPSATYEYDNGVLSIHFHNIVGDGIVGFEQTAVSTDDDGTNTWRITLKSGALFDISVKNGSKGSKGEQGEKGEKGNKGDKGDKGEKGEPFRYEDFTAAQLEALRGRDGAQGATGVYNSSTQDFLTTLETTKGNSQTKTMTQKAITDELNSLDSKIYEENTTQDGEPIDTSAYTVESWFISVDDGTWHTGSLDNRCRFMPATQGDTLKVQNTQEGMFDIAFLTSGTHGNAGDEPAYASDTTLITVRDTSAHYYVVPDNTTYIYIRVKKTGANLHPVFTKVTKLADKLDEAFMEKVYPIFKKGQISTSGYSWNTVTNMVSNEVIFDENVNMVKVVNPSPSKTYYMVYIIASDGTITNIGGGYLTNSITFTPTAGSRYVFRIKAVAATSQMELEALSEEDFPYFAVKRVGNPIEPMESDEIIQRIANAKFSTRSDQLDADKKPLGLLHFSDIHGDTIAAEQLKKWYRKYVGYCDDMLNTGDVVFTYAHDTSSAEGYDWWQHTGLPEMCLNAVGNHDGACPSGSTHIISDDKPIEGWVWDGKGKEWDYDNYIAPYIDGKGITMPAGYDDSDSPNYKACYYYKDYADKSIRLIVLDCMHRFDGIVDPTTGQQDGDNAGLKHLTTEQEEWLVARLNETLTSGDDAYGYSVVVACHYPLDDYDGANAKAWADRTHDYTDFNRNTTGGYVVNHKTGDASNWHYQGRQSFEFQKQHCLRNLIDNGYAQSGAGYLKGNVNNFGNIIDSFIDRGGKFVVWLSGHMHSNLLYYPTKFPNILVYTNTMAGGLKLTSNNDRMSLVTGRASATFICVDTYNQHLKLVKLGQITDKLLTPIHVLCYDYANRIIINEW